MKPGLLLACLAAVALVGCKGVPVNNNTSSSATGPLTIVPYPQSVERQPGQLTLADGVALTTTAATPNSNRAIANLLSRLELATDNGANTEIQLRKIDDPELGSEGYRLYIGSDIALRANTDTGLFYAVQTLRQLLPAKPAAGYSLPHVDITDYPAYAWRGSSIDVARNFLPISYLKKHINRMALFKLNRFHLHLTDDQGWRIEIKQYPRLTEVGGASAVEGGRSGYYTQEELKNLVVYAAARGVTIVPEIEMPSHIQAALASYNELACDDVTNLSTYSGREVGFSILCLSKPKVIYPFVRNVLKEVVGIFPSRYIHIGGDEIDDPLYNQFIARATSIVDDLGRTAIAWEEASTADTDKDVVYQLWNDEYPIEKAVAEGHKIILSPCSYFYLDHGNYAGQPNTYDWCTKAGVSLERVYSFKPGHFKGAIGVEGALWSELSHSNAAVDNRLWPRLAAVAEIGWTPTKARRYGSFAERLGELVPHFDALGIHYYPDPDLGW